MVCAESHQPSVGVCFRPHKLARMKLRQEISQNNRGHFGGCRVGRVPTAESILYIMQGFAAASRGGVSSGTSYIMPIDPVSAVCNV